MFKGLHSGTSRHSDLLPCVGLIAHVSPVSVASALYPVPKPSQIYFDGWLAIHAKNKVVAKLFHFQLGSLDPGSGKSRSAGMAPVYGMAF